MKYPVSSPKDRSPRTLIFGVVGIIGVVLAAALSGSMASAQKLPGETTTQWVAQPALGVARAGHGVASARGVVYTVGGRSAEVENLMLDSVEARKLGGPGEWAAIAPLPLARGNLSVAEAGGLVYAIGGLSATATFFGSVTEVDRYRPATGQWETVAPLPEPRDTAGAASLKGTLYVAGGFIEDAPFTWHVTDSVLAYDTHANTWRSVAPMPEPRQGFRLVAAGKYLYAVGGMSGEFSAALATAQRYDPATDTWTELAPMNESRWLPCAVQISVGGHELIAVVGGTAFAADGSFIQGRATTEIFDAKTGDWGLLDVLMPYGSGSIDCAVRGSSTILVIGGAREVPGNDGVYVADVRELTIKPEDVQ
jgi:N-acetylneuraminic acid mutarotase